jgi:hypothetical protein
VLALYPRNELLKDQFAEVYSQARRLDVTLSDGGRRKILIGTFFGPTPYSAEKAHDDGQIDRAFEFYTPWRKPQAAEPRKRWKNYFRAAGSM